MIRSAVAAVILAAGFSSRMERFKPLLPLGDTTVVERVAGLYRAAGIGEIVCVAGYRAEELMPVLRNLGVTPIRNLRHTEGMFSSVLSGVANLSAGIGAFFLHPVDIPLVRRSTLDRLIEISGEHPRAILYPNFLGKRGHPPLIPEWCIPRILQWDGTRGLRGLLARHEDQAVDVPVADRFVRMDMDTPSDYRALLEEMKSPSARWDLPDKGDRKGRKDS